MRLGLSRRKHLPVFYVTSGNFTSNFPLWQFRRAKQFDKFLKESGLKLDYWGFAALEELLSIGKYYLPNFDLTGKTVLDVGACCGETAWFFLKHGAEKVICVEADPARSKIILENKKTRGLNLEVYAEPFDPAKHLQLKHDFLKVDIEGYEKLMLPYAETCGPCVIETHTPNLREAFEKKGFHVVKKLKTASSGSNRTEICLLANYP